MSNPISFSFQIVGEAFGVSARRRPSMVFGPNWQVLRS
jgi:hypothetical protein